MESAPLVFHLCVLVGCFECLYRVSPSFLLNKRDRLVSFGYRLSSGSPDLDRNTEKVEEDVGVVMCQIPESTSGLGSLLRKKQSEIAF